MIRDVAEFDPQAVIRAINKRMRAQAGLPPRPTPSELKAKTKQDRDRKRKRKAQRSARRTSR